MRPKHLLLLAAIGSAFLQDADMDYNDEDVTNFFDEVVVPMREAAKEAQVTIRGATTTFAVRLKARAMKRRKQNAEGEIESVDAGGKT